MVSETAEKTNQILDKVDNFQYFVLLGTFTMMLDSALIYVNGISVLSVSWNYINTNITIGSALTFICFFSLYISYIVTGLQQFVSAILISLPHGTWDIFNPSKDYCNKPSNEEYIYVSDLKSYAIKNNNAVALEVVNSKRDEVYSTHQIERYSFAFLIASVINWAVSTDSNNSIFTKFFYFSFKDDLIVTDTIKFTLGCFLYMTIFYLGVIRGSGLVDTWNDNYKIYLPGHKNNFNKHH